MPRTATIGPAVYKRVTELTAEGKNAPRPSRPSPKNAA
jgi:hypothetical protein